MVPCSGEHIHQPPFAEMWAAIFNKNTPSFAHLVILTVATWSVLYYTPVNS